MSGTHPEHEDFPWTIAVVDHPPRKDSAAYGAQPHADDQAGAATLPDWVLAR